MSHPNNAERHPNVAKKDMMSASANIAARKELGKDEKTSTGSNNLVEGDNMGGSIAGGNK